MTRVLGGKEALNSDEVALKMRVMRLKVRIILRS